MKYSNGDMEDLFRRASERYPLKTDSADWGRLASALDGEPAPPSDQGEKRRRRGIIWWFLLIPLTGIGYLMWQEGMQHTAGKDKVAASGKVGVATAGKNGVATAQSGKIAATVTEAGAGQGGNGAGGGNEPGKDVRGTRDADESRSGGGRVRKMRTRGDAGANVGVSQNAVAIDGQGVVRSQAAGKDVSGGGKVRSLRTPDRSAEVGSTVDGQSKIGGANMGGVDHELVLAVLDLRLASIGSRNRIDVDVVSPAAGGGSLNPVADGSKPNDKKQTSHSHGYIGIFGAPDFSMVHFQTLKGVGTTFGVLLGYSFNDRWAVETGLNLDRKRYFTEGEYFNTKNVRTPPYSTLLNVDGTCFMWEIPVNVRYNFSTGTRMKWFATAGLSTYLMSKEDYTYQYETNLTTENSQWNLHRPSQNWFSIINLSAGFEQRVGKIGNLRLEPYVRIPLSGIGTGNLPILSAGLNIGFTRQLW